MTTIQAAELRKNMDQYLKRASKGEKFKISYRGKLLAVLAQDEDARPTSNATALFAAAAKIRASIPIEVLEKFERMSYKERDDMRYEDMKAKYNEK